ncbi:hypothetical protein HPB48_001648 [Haemaphysalis longicornis]|uniref:Uncharacterized protein n=1 Tax=Haemaphysalis longicornis TaxID=44386 RepID=A0A9J6FZQ6_HAELO|nr:hypothetical protein HPB48_001648 [Haemaphysalis longicornis]
MDADATRHSSKASGAWIRGSPPSLHPGQDETASYRYETINMSSYFIGQNADFERSALPSIPAMTRTLQRQRRSTNALPPAPRSLADIVLNDDFLTMANGQQCLLYDAGPQDP